MEVIVSVVTAVTSVLAVLIGLAKLTHLQRRAVWDWTRRLTLLFFYFVVVVGSVIGMVIFAFRTAPMTRPEVLMQLGHAFNLICYTSFFVTDLVKWINSSGKEAESDEAEAASATQNGAS